MENNLHKLIDIMKYRRMGYTELMKEYPILMHYEYLRYTETYFIHSASIFIGSKNKLNILSIGENKTYNNGISKHAEMDTIDKLPIRKKKKLLRVNLLVIRLTKRFILGNSYPCAICLKYLYENSYKKGYIIDKIYYSNKNGIIENDKFINLIMSNKQIFSAYYKNINKEKFITWINKL